MDNSQDTKFGMPVGYNSQLIQDYLANRLGAIGAQKKVAYGNLDTERGAMMEALGRSQLQNERDILTRRTQAQRSGLTSSQIAAQEMQNMQVGQMGVEQIAQQLLQQENALNLQYAGAEDTAKADVFQIINQNLQSAAAVDAQKYASSAISQAKELFPNATPEQALIISRQINGADLGNSEKAILAKMNNPEMLIETGTGVNGRLSKTEFNNKYSTAGISYSDYKKAWDATHPNGTGSTNNSNTVNDSLAYIQNDLANKSKP